MQTAERLIREHKVAVMPGTAFGMTEGCYFRVAYGALQKATVAEGIRAAWSAACGSLLARSAAPAHAADATRRASSTQPSRRRTRGAASSAVARSPGLRALVLIHPRVASSTSGSRFAWRRPALRRSRRSARPLRAGSRPAPPDAANAACSSPPRARFRLGARHQDEELVAAPAEHVVGLADVPQQEPRHFPAARDRRSSCPSVSLIVLKRSTSMKTIRHRRLGARGGAAARGR